jgi:hypothetical protein
MGDKDNAFKPFTSWKSRTPTLDDLRERMAALALGQVIDRWPARSFNVKLQLRADVHVFAQRIRVITQQRGGVGYDPA